MNKQILTEAAGSLTAGYLINAVKKSGNISVATDANNDSFGKYLCDKFFLVPYASSPDSKASLLYLCKKHNIDIVIPTLDDSLLTWANLSEELLKNGTHVASSKESTLKIFLDKWETFLFFRNNGIPTPKTSLKQDYPLVKPRLGRGGSGIQLTDKLVNMEGNISQELLSGTEYTVDVFCNQDGDPIYIVPRIRIGVKEGKATGGIVVKQETIINIVKKICASIQFWGPINIQCFETENNEVFITEINPRFGGGSALGMAATENWINLIEKMIYGEKVYDSVPIKYGLKMGRYYSEVFYE